MTRAAGWWRGVVLAVALCVTTTACDTVAGQAQRGAGPSSPTAASDASTGALTLSSRPEDLSTVVAATSRSLTEFWSDQLPQVYGTAFRPLAGGIQAKTPSSPSFSCGGQPLTYQDVQGNAFYCGTGGDDFIAYDAASLLPQLDRAFGGLTPAVVIAHETGHAIQQRAGVDAPSVLVELQADCFAGAWTAFAQRSSSDPVAVARDGLDAAVRALPLLRDQPGTAASRQGAHGLGFDRVNAFQTGYDSGAQRCASVATGQATVTELPFRTVAEAQSGGDLPYSQTLSVAVQQLEAFWTAALPRLAPGTTWTSPQVSPQSAAPLPTCDGDTGYDAQAPAAYCTSAGAVVWADDALAQVHDADGDLASAAALSLAWARAGQAEAGLATSGHDATLQQVCLTGAWVAYLASADGTRVSLSPGDIDEALSEVLAPPAGGGDDDPGSFSRADAYRSGVLGGLGGC